MISQAELKRVRALHQKKVRTETGRFLVQGRKVVEELLASSLRTELILATAEAAAWLEGRAGAGRAPVHVVAAHELERAGTFETGNELVAVAEIPGPLDFRAPTHGELMLALDGVADPRNLGGLLRIADWFGVGRVLCGPDCMERWNPKAVQSSMGSVFRVEVRVTPLIEELHACAAAGAGIYLADMGGASVFETKLAAPAVMVLGSESHGLSAAVRELDAQVISIPRIGRAESLNVAMAASALCTEFLRQARAG